MLDADRIYQDLRSDLQRMEEERTKTVRKLYPYKIFFQLCMLVVLVETVHMVFFDGFSDLTISITAGCFVFGVLVYVIKHAYESRKYKRLFQQKIAAQIIPKLGSGFTYQPDGNIPEEELKRTMLFNYFNKYHCEDLVSGSIANKNVRYVEIKLELKTTRSKETNYRTIFEGVFLIIELKIVFPSPFWILPKKMRFPVVKGTEGQLIKMDHPEFSEIYAVYGQDTVSSKKLLVAPILDSLLRLNNSLKSRKVIDKDIYFSFIDNKIAIAFPTIRKFMEPTLREQINTKAFIEGQLVFLNGVHQVAALVG